MHDNDRLRLGLIALVGVGAWFFMGTKKQAKMSAKGLAMLEKLEGFSGVPYPDGAGYSVGYGSRISMAEAEQYKITPITQSEAKRKMVDFLNDLSITLNLSAYKFPQNVIDAILMLGYNIGAYQLLVSDCWKLLKQHDYTAAANEWDFWYVTDRKTGDKVISPALQNRRYDERLLLIGGHYL